MCTKENNEDFKPTKYEIEAVIDKLNTRHLELIISKQSS
jgi:hypothetical protein